MYQKSDVVKHDKEICCNSNRKKNITVIILLIVCVLIAVSILIVNVIIPKNKYTNAITLMDAGKYDEAISEFEELEGYEDSDKKIEECIEGKYKNAIGLMNAGNIVDAYEALIALDGYKDSNDKAKSIFEEYKIAKLRVAKVGDYIFYGEYEQDNDISNGKEDIEWLVLDIEDGKALVLSKYALDCKWYDVRSEITWAASSIRKWLNNDFVEEAFNYSEFLYRASVPAYENPAYNINAGADTIDTVFLLSTREASLYLNSDSLSCKATDYAIAKGASSSSSDSCTWWLRTPGQFQGYASVVSGGMIIAAGMQTWHDYAVRPAMWIVL